MRYDSFIAIRCLLEIFDEWVKLAQLGDKLGLQDIWLRADMAYQDSFSDITFALTETERARFFPYANSCFSDTLCFWRQEQRTWIGYAQAALEQLIVQQALRPP